MSWDIVLFSSKQKITSIEDINYEQFVPVDFDSILQDHFINISINGDHREINEQNYCISYFSDNEPTSNLTIQLHGETGLYEIITVPKKNSWQIFDTENGEKIDMNSLEHNGHESFESYRRQIINETNADK